MRNIFPARNIENSKGFSKNQIGIKFLLGEIISCRNLFQTLTSCHWLASYPEGNQDFLSDFKILMGFV